MIVFKEKADPWSVTALVSGILARTIPMVYMAVMEMHWNGNVCVVNRYYENQSKYAVVLSQ